MLDSRTRWLQSVQIERLLERSGVDVTFLGAYCAPPPVHLPSGGADYLHPSNERLAQLKRIYEASDCPGRRRSQWDNSFVSQEVPLQAFRGDCAFIWQHRDLNLPVTYLLTYYYLQHCRLGHLLSCMPEDDLFGIYGVPESSGLLTRDRLDSCCEISFLLKHAALDRHRNVLDIGSGYGRFAHRLSQVSNAIETWCVDAVPEASFLCEYYLRFRGCETRAHMVPISDVEVLLESCSIDLAVNMHSFSECPQESIAWWISMLRKHEVRQLFIVPNGTGFDGERLLSLEDDYKRNDLSPLFSEFGYELSIAAPKYGDQHLQRFGVTPTKYFLYSLKK